MKILTNYQEFYKDFYPELSDYDGNSLITFGNHDRADVKSTIDTNLDTIINNLPENWTPDIIIIFLPEHNLFPPGIERSEVVTIAVISDWDRHYQTIECVSKIFDICIAGGEEELVETLKKLGAKNVFKWTIENLAPHIKRNKNSEKIYDVSFIGSLGTDLWIKRTKYAERLQLLSDKYNILISNNIYGEDYCKILNQSKIVFNHSSRGEPNLKIFETMGTGTLVFTEENNAEVEFLFNDREHLVLYNDRNFEDLIEYYIKNEEEREKIALNGYEFVRSKHTTKHRVNELMDLLNSLDLKKIKNSRTQNYWDANLNINLGQSYIKKGHYELAVKCFLQANQDRPFQSLLNIGIAYLLLSGRPEFSPEKKNELINAGFSNFEIAKDLDNKNFLPYLLIAIFKHLFRDFYTSKIFFEQALNKLEYTDNIPDNFLLLKSMDLANISIDLEIDSMFYKRLMGKKDELKTYLKKQTIFWSGLMAFSENKWMETIDILEKETLFEKDGNVSFMLGCSYDKLNDYGIALKHYNRAIEMRPFFFDARLCLCQLLNKLGRKEEYNSLSRESKLLFDIDYKNISNSVIVQADNTRFSSYFPGIKNHLI